MQTSEVNRDRIGRLLSSVTLYRAGDTTYILSGMRDALVLLYPEYEETIYTVDTLHGPRYCISVRKEERGRL